MEIETSSFFKRRINYTIYYWDIQEEKWVNSGQWYYKNINQVHEALERAREKWPAMQFRMEMRIIDALVDDRNPTNVHPGPSRTLED